MSGTLEVGRNCWRRERAERLSFLIDGAAYFAALADALPRAREQVLIAGWDVDGRLRLRRDRPRNGPPDNLRELLNFIVAQRPGLHVHVLLWDFAVIYALEREPLPSVNLGLRTADRVHVELDSSAPMGGCRHEKIVVIDDRVAFCGGIDLANTRWDTPEHAPGDPRRVMPDGDAYEPFHDVQVAVAGEAAAALGEHCRERWRLATGEELAAPAAGGDPWPPELHVDAEGVAVGIARTVPAEERENAVREVERLYLDAIAAAKKSVYIENQYFTSQAIGSAIAERLGEADGPEFVLVMPRRCSGWLEEQTMGLLRAQLLRRLERSDEHGRLRVYTPVIGDGDARSLKVHAKVLVVDDVLARVGSSNLTARSLGLDSECDLAIEAGEEDGQARGVIRSLSDRLLAEHLGVDPERVQREREATDSLIEAIEPLAGGDRTLAPLEPQHQEMPASASALVAAVSDPDRPLDGSVVAEEFRDRVVEGVVRFSGVLGLCAVALAIAALALAWRYTGLADYVDVDTVMAWLERLRASTLAPFALLVIYLVLGLVAFPVTILNAATAIAFGPWLGFGYAVAGSMVSAALTFVLGRRLGRDVIRRFSSGAVYQAVHAVGRRGFLAVLSCRLVPIAPFTVINLVAGAMPIRVRDYLVGTFVGMAPGIAVLAAFGDRVEKVLEDPSLTNLGLLGLVVAAWFALGWGLSHLMRQHGQQRHGE